MSRRKHEVGAVGAEHLLAGVLAWLTAEHRNVEARTAGELVAVQLARDFGASWDDIGQACGLSRQAAHKRFATMIEPPGDAPQRHAAPPDMAE